MYRSMEETELVLLQSKKNASPWKCPGPRCSEKEAKERPGAGGGAES